MTIQTLDQLIAGMNNAETALFVKQAVSNTTQGFLFSTWNYGNTPVAGAIPGTTAAVLTKASVGSLDPFDSPTGAQQVYLARWSAQVTAVPMEIQMFDRLIHVGGFDATLTTAQTANIDVTNAGAARIGKTNYTDVLWYIEIYTDIGTTQVNATVTYTNVAGTSGRTTTVAIGSTTNSLNRRARMIPIVTSNNEAIKSIQSVTLSASTTTAGSFGITAMRFISNIGFLSANSAVVNDWTQLGLPIVPENACLFLCYIAGTTATGACSGIIKLIRG